MKNNIRSRLKLSIIIGLIAVFFLLIFVVIQKQARPLEFRRVALVDVIGNNYIFRGNNPLLTVEDKTFMGYEELTKHFNNRLSEQGLPKLKDYYLVSVSLLDLNEYFLAKKEEAFFAKYPQVGEVKSMSIVSLNLWIGSQKIPYLSSLLDGFYNLWFTEKLMQIHNLASSVGPKPKVIYIHCNAGRDRTGMLVANYKMLFNKNTTLQNIRLENEQESGRNSKVFFDKAMRSYCEYLKKYLHKPLDCT